MIAYADNLPAASVWMVEIVGSAPSGEPRPPPFGIVVGLPLVSLGFGPEPTVAASSVRMSDRGWIGEPDDADAPNESYPPRLIEAPALEFSIPIYPDAARRADVQAGELLIANGDGGAEALAGDWTVAGRQVVIRRGPHRRPNHAAFADLGLFADMRVARSLAGSSRLTLRLTSAAADLRVPACNTYAGTGGAEGPTTLAGQFKPRLYGIRRAFTPIQVDAGLLLYQINDGPIDAVLLVRNRGVDQVFDTDYANYAGLAAASIASGEYVTCLAEGMIRLGSQPSFLTVSAQGDAEPTIYGYAADAATIAVKLLRGPGGVSTTRSPLPAFASWPPGDGGLWVTGGTVEDALNRLASGIHAWWGADAQGYFYGGWLTAPEAGVPFLELQPWMLASAPQEQDQPRAPWWRARVGYQGRDTVSEGEDVAGAVSDADRNYLSQPYWTATQVNLYNQTAYAAAAEDAPLLDGFFDADADAQDLVDRLIALFGPPRRVWTFGLKATAWTGFAPDAVKPGAILSLSWPTIGALATGRIVLVRSLSIRGDSLELTVWG